ncbi:Fic family protein [Patescibacteria group bacterium]|nr:Fic family protein [Patescibacteria group bacterium]MBU1124133.1 Fic family protein [Patescibacteria group bacterium]MBU1910869.1 Fic family protein [Patescibacteria group bacterium]
MNIPQKLRLLMQITGLTQTKLAQELGVSFVSLNRWLNNKAVPRAGMQKRIDALCLKYAEIKDIPDKPLDAKMAILWLKKKQNKNLLNMILKYPDIHDQFVLVLTYTSNTIEGSTLTKEETAAVLFDNVTLPNRTLVEQMEAKNHQAALRFLFKYLQNNRKINEGLILKLHSILMNGIRDDAGIYRSHAVRIVGANVPTANYLKVPTLMKKFVNEACRSKKKTMEYIAKTHAQFEQIHPFSDGNGRIGRLIMHAMLLCAGLPPAVIDLKKKRRYYAALQKAQLESDIPPLEEFLCDSVLEGFKILERS